MATLNWQIGNGTKSYMDVVCDLPHAVAGPLSDTEVEARRPELGELTRTSFAHRALLSFMNCLARRTFWTAVVLHGSARTEVSGSIGRKAARKNHGK